MNDVFQFRSNSRPVKPGAGAGERATAVYTLPLNFRQILSNFYLSPLEYKGVHYASAEHAFHAAKLKRFGQDALAARFAVGGDVAHNDRAPVILQGGCSDFGSGGAEAVDHDSQRPVVLHGGI